MDKAKEDLEDSRAHVAQRFWRNLDEREDTEQARQAAQNEFEPDTVNDSLPTTTVTRRGFLGLLGGAATVMATAACSPKERSIVPYTKRPQEIIPGIANYYASTFTEGERSFSVLVKTREGRPIHITGNDEDPRLKGKTSLRAIADVMALYDSDRLRAPTFERRSATWNQFEQVIAAIVTEAKRDSKPILLMTGASNSPTRKALLAALRAQLPTLEHLVWEPGRGDAAQLAARAAYGVPVRPRLRLAQAKVVLSLGADFLNGDDLEAIADFTSQRRPAEPVADMNRLWVFEGPLTLTGANADQRLSVRPSAIAAIAFALARGLNEKHGIALPAGAQLAPVPPDLLQQSGISAEIWERLLSDLAQARAQALVIAGDTTPADAQVAAYLLNVMLGSRAVELRPAEALATLSDIDKAIREMEAGRYSAAILWGVNPVYAFPDTAAFSAALAKVPQRIWIGSNPDETAQSCPWNLPENHWLESWGDFGDGDVLTLQQPAIAPLYDTKQGEELLLMALRALKSSNAADYQSYLNDRWRNELYASDSLVPFGQFMNAVLHDGVLRRDSVGPSPLVFDASVVAESSRRGFEQTPAGDFELVLHVGTQLYDGRYANNAWLQELPDPITKNTWGNPLTISVEDARKLQLKSGDLVEVVVDSKSLSLPVIVQPGQASGVLALALGYGRTVGTVARGVGKNAYTLLGRSGPTAHVRQQASLKKLGGSVRLALTQSHHRMEGRDLVRSFTLPEFAAEAKSPRKKIQLTTLYAEQAFPEHKWGMVIDLAACIGCSACVVACQSENNIATVGPEQVERGREMHWLRIDTYYEGSEANPTVVHQPMLCQHCDAAPCENVCPVNATNHSPDGLNQMVYNRCVGTRYCANNCPYKVRRYNFFDYTSEKTESAKLAFNPEVTVRPRGVMEKCTFCVQRIEDGRMRAKVEKRSLRDGDIVTACASACPSGAIVFGDLKDPQSRVARLAGTKRGYKVLEEVGARPAVTYLANLRNPGVDGDAHE